MADIDDFFDPDLYDDRVGPGERVAELYLKWAAKDAGPVLEIGCGTGDILLPLARNGTRVTGVDRSPVMLARLREKLTNETDEVRQRVSLYVEDAISLRVEGSYTQVFAPNEFCSLMLNDDDLLRMFLRCKALLTETGRLVLDVPPFRVDELAKFCDRQHAFFRERGIFARGDGSSVQVSERTLYDQTTRRLDALFRYDFLDQSGTITRSYLRQLCLKPRNEDEMRLLLLLAGFARVERQQHARSDGSLTIVFHAYQ